MDRQRIIINADDLGLERSVNDAIFEVFRAGNLSSATLMVAMPGTGDAVERLRDHPGLAVGLHFTLTEGNALTGPSSLTDGAGRFIDRSTLAKRTIRGQAVASDIRQEFEAQLRKAEALGVVLTHSDSHQHVMMLPAVMDAISPVLQERAMPVRLVEPPSGMVHSAWRRPRKFLKQWVNKRLAHRHRRSLRTTANDSLVSIHDLADPGPYSNGTYQGLLKATDGREVVEVMVHPYILGDGIKAMYGPVWAAKEPFLLRCLAEYEALRGPRIFDAQEVINFADL